MANLKVSQLPEQTVISPVDFLYLISAGQSKQVHVNTVKTWNNQDISTIIANKQDAISAGTGIAIVGNQIRLADPVSDPVALYLAASS